MVEFFSFRRQVCRCLITGVAVVCAVLVARPAAPARHQASTTLEVQHISAVRVNGAGSTVIWQARVLISGGQFQLYAGESLDQLRVISTAAAAPGIDQYQFHQPTQWPSVMVFQLRFADAEGGEQVLATAVVRYQDINVDPEQISTVDPTLKAMYEVRGGPCLEPSWFRSPNPSRLPDGAAPRPEVPPPRLVSEN